MLTYSFQNLSHFKMFLLKPLVETMEKFKIQNSEHYGQKGLKQKLSFIDFFQEG